MIPGLTAFPGRDSLMQAAAERLADALKHGIAERGSGCALLSGGGTPGQAYERLAAIGLDWSKVTFGLVDERFVPPSDPASNEGLLRRTLAPALAAGAAIAPMYAPGTPAGAADRANRAYESLAIDIALMGMGGDGHTASWFADAEGLGEALLSTRTIVQVRAPVAIGVADRLTITRAALQRASRVLLVITGKAKRDRLEQALDAKDAPVAHLFDGANAALEVLYAD